MEETVIADEKKKTSASKPLAAGGASSARAAKKINEVQPGFETRYKTGLKELDRVLGGGIVKGSLILVGGDPGIGKSTLLLQICQKAGEDKKILYVSGEESEGQIKLRAERLGVTTENLYLMSETDAEIIIDSINDIKPQIVIIDSIQTIHRDDISSAAGSVPQVREATNAFMRVAKSMGIAMFIVDSRSESAGAYSGLRAVLRRRQTAYVQDFEGGQEPFRLDERDRRVRDA